MTVTLRAPGTARPDAPVRLIGIDIDGTLLDSREPAARAQPARGPRRRRPRHPRRAGHGTGLPPRDAHRPRAARHPGLPARQARPTWTGGDSLRRGHRARRSTTERSRPRDPCDGTLIVSNGALTKGTDGATRALPAPAARRRAGRRDGAPPAARRASRSIFDRPDAQQYVYEGIDWSNPNRAWYYERKPRLHDPRGADRGRR